MPEGAAETAHTPLRVLFVDDEASILKALSRLFEDEPYELFTATSGEEGLATLRREPDVAVIVSDQRMPGMNGAEFLEKSRGIAPDAVRIVLTGYADIEAAVAAINRGGAYRYTAKPWKDEEFLQIVRDAASRFSLVRENARLTEIVRKQNEELKEWNGRLGQRVLEQTRQIRTQNDSLRVLNTRLEKSFGDTLAAFAALLELRDPSERNHSGNVAVLSEAIAAAAGLPPEETETVRTASLLHDIGKIGGPAPLKRREAAGMTVEETKVYAEHAVRGQMAVTGIEALRPAGALIRHHHERWDGAGFPDGLRATEIPSGARIIALADFIDREMAKCHGDNATELVLTAVRREKFSGRFDPRLIPAVDKAVAAVYARSGPGTGVVEEEVRTDDLIEGMTLTRDILSGTGILLLRAGTTLDPQTISALSRNLKLDPSRTGIFVDARRNPA